jgi:hypothetical protein
MDTCIKCLSSNILGPYYLKYELVDDITTAKLHTAKLRDISTSIDIKTKITDVFAYNALPSVRMKDQPPKLKYAFYTCDECGYTELYLDPVYRNKILQQQMMKKKENDENEKNRFCSTCGKPLLTRICTNCKKY